MREGAANCSLNMSDVQRLGNVVERSDTHSLDGIVNGLLSANHDYYRIGVLCKNAWDQIESANSTHIYVTDYQLESGRVQNGKSLFGGSYTGTFVFGTQQLLEELSNLLIIADDQNRGLLFGDFSHCVFVSPYD